MKEALDSNSKIKTCKKHQIFEVNRWKVEWRCAL